MIKVFIASRVGAKTKRQFEKNLLRYRAFARMAILQGHGVEATGPYYCMLLNDSAPEERELGMKLGRERIKNCQKVWVLLNEDGSISQGMAKDIETVHAHNVQCATKLADWEKMISIQTFTTEQVEDWLKANDKYGYELWQKSK